MTDLRCILDRFSRPSYSGRTRATTTAPAVDEEVVKDEAKPVAASPLRGRSDYLPMIWD